MIYILRDNDSSINFASTIRNSSYLSGAILARLLIFESKMIPECNLSYCSPAYESGPLVDHF